MKTKIKSITIFFGIFIAALALYGIITCGYFRWWMIPSGIICGVYLVGIIIVGYIKARRGEW